MLDFGCSNRKQWAQVKQQAASIEESNSKQAKQRKLLTSQFRSRAKSMHKTQAILKLAILVSVSVALVEVLSRRVVECQPEVRTSNSSKFELMPTATASATATATATLSHHNLETQTAAKIQVNPIKSQPGKRDLSGAAGSQLQRGASAGSRGRKTTLYACEGTQLDIECQPAESIELVRANYGRFSIQTCNELGHLDWSINCTSPASFQIIDDSCQGKRACRLLASNSIFGDACPGTQKYLEVHYQCVPTTSNSSSSNTGNSRHYAPSNAQPGFAQGSSFESVKHQQQLQQLQQNHQVTLANQLPNTQHNQASSETILGSAQFGAPPPAQSRPLAPATIAGGGEQQSPPPASTGSSQQQPAFPAWMPPLRPSAASPAVASTGERAPTSPLASSQPPVATGRSFAKCPELVWRQIRWPASEPGQLVRMACPRHASPSDASDPSPASFACLPTGQWAPRVQAAHCQSVWLRNLTQRLEAGDSALSALREMSRATDVPIFETSRLYYNNLNSEACLFGDDLVEMARIVTHLVDEIGDLLLRISDDKQRSTFASEFVKSLAELISNLSDDVHIDAWLDLKDIQGARQRIAGQLIKSLESASVLLAGTLQQQANPLNNDDETTLFIRQSDNVIVSISSIALPFPLPSQTGTNKLNKSIELIVPKETGFLGFKWMNLDQRFTLHLQASEVPTTTAMNQLIIDNVNNPENLAPNPRALKLVHVMYRTLGSQMGPSDRLSDSGGSSWRQLVNSNLVSLSIVADSRYKFSPLKVDLAAPLELVLRHLEPLGSMGPPPSCVYWDSSLGDWQSDGCKLIESNKTHSVCACTHLTTFGLLSKWDSEQPLEPGQRQFQPQFQQHPVLQLDNIENELFVPLQPIYGEGMSLYLGKMLEGELFASGSGGTSLHLIVVISCLASVILLSVYLAAAFYNKIHANRLLASIPLHPAPSMLVTSSNNLDRSSALIHAATLQRQPPTGSDPSQIYASNMIEANDYATAVCKQTQSMAMECAGNSLWPSNTLSYGVWPDRAKQAQTNRRRLVERNLRHFKQLRIPIYVMLYLFAVQLLIVLLVESQGLFPQPRYAFAGSRQASTETQPLPPMGPVSWLLVSLLYYLVSAISFWLISRCVELSILMIRPSLLLRRPTSSDQLQSPSNAASSADPSTVLAGSASTASSDASERSDKTNPSHYDNSSNSVLGLGAHSVNPVNSTICGPRATRKPALYGARVSQNCYSTGSNHVNSASSSAYSSIETNQHAQLARFNRRNVDNDSDDDEQFCWAKLSGSNLNLGFALVHLAPIITSFGFIVSSSSSKLYGLLNSMLYVTSLALQVASWPLLIVSTWQYFMLLLSIVFIACLCCFFVVIFRPQWQAGSAKRRNDISAAARAKAANCNKATNPYGSSSMLSHHHTSQTHGHLTSSLANLGAANLIGHTSNGGTGNASGNPFALTKLHPFGAQINDHQPKDGSSTMIGKQQNVIAKDLKRPKFVCTMLVIFCLCHLLCWSSFLIFVRRALETNPLDSGPSTQTGPNAGATNRWQNHHWMYAFASSNFIMVVIVGLCERRSVRRAIQLAGLSRFIWLPSCHQTVSTGRGFDASLYQRRHHYSTGANGNLGPNKLVADSSVATNKVSPSSHSLFLVSSSHSQQEQQRQASGPIYGASNYQHQYPSEQQHLYQPIYGDSSLTLNERHLNQRQQQQQQANNMMQLMQHQQAPQQTLNRSISQPHQPLMMIDANGALKQQQQQQQQFCHFDQLQASKTMGQHRAMQHLMQHSGEADGPLVALAAANSDLAADSQQQSRRLAPATFGPSQRQQQSLAAPRDHQYEHQLFSANQRAANPIQQQQQQQQQDFRSANGSCVAMGNNQAGYSMRQQQQQQQQSMHFRRASQHRSLMNYPSQQSGQEFDCESLNKASSKDNIYDTANNYTLVQ